MAKLYFYYSAMNAGKTTVLLQSAHNYRERGMYPLLFKPRFDDRYSVGRIRSRIGLESPAIAFGPDDDLYNQVRDELAERNVHCVLVDEAQFLVELPTQAVFVGLAGVEPAAGRPPPLRAAREHVLHQQHPVVGIDHDAAHRLAPSHRRSAVSRSVVSRSVCRSGRR